jgi:hypothetical protein
MSLSPDFSAHFRPEIFLRWTPNALFLRKYCLLMICIKPPNLNEIKYIQIPMQNYWVKIPLTITSGLYFEPLALIIYSLRNFLHCSYFLLCHISAQFLELIFCVVSPNLEIRGTVFSIISSTSHLHPCTHICADTYTTESCTKCIQWIFWLLILLYEIEILNSKNETITLIKFGLDCRICLPYH